jgi:GDP-L-fucose synthase
MVRYDIATKEPTVTTIAVTGATGFLGRHLTPLLQDRWGENEVALLNSSDYDLMDPVQVQAMFDDLKPRFVIHLAAYSGGIGANREFPADFYHRNTMLTTLMFDAAARNGVEKLIVFMGGCGYPRTSTSPISEDQMWNGLPQPESEGYSMAKKMGIIASRAYRQQHGLNSVVLLPGNMYGEFDNFRDGESHVVPGMLRRYLEAKRNGDDSVAMWGTGEPVRDFVYAGDVAACIPWFLENYDSSEPVNISSGTTTSIKELAETIKETVGYEGTIQWDATKPNGQMIKIFNIDHLNSLGLTCPTPMREGLQRAAAWLEANYDDHGDGLRL